MSGFKPNLVIDRETGKLCMQVVLGGHTATAELPDCLATYSEEQLRVYFDDAVPKLTKLLEDHRKRDKRLLKWKAKCSTGSTDSFRELEVEIAQVLPFPSSAHNLTSRDHSPWDAENGKNGPTES